MNKNDRKNREIWIGENRLYLDEDDMLYITIIGEVDEKIAVLLNEAYLNFLTMFEGKMDIFVDLNRAGKPSPEARKIWIAMAENEKTGKIAMLGIHPVARVLASFVMGVSKKEGMRFFKTKEEALAWLNEGIENG